MKGAGPGLPAGARVAERSWLAFLAARRLRANKIAMVLGRTVHLWGADAAEFLNDPAWVAHERAHLEQFRRFGTVRFVLMYLLESARRGYRDNRFEVEARRAARNARSADP